MAGDIFDCWDWTRRDAGHRTAPTTKHGQVQNVRSAEAEKPWLHSYLWVPPVLDVGYCWSLSGSFTSALVPLRLLCP